MPGAISATRTNPPMTTDQPELVTTDVEVTDVPVAEPTPVEAEALDLDTPVRTLDGPEYIEVDGVMVPNYDGTLPLFSEGDVVTGRVVRVDKDEVLVDIGYKSEGVIPLPELSIRKSVKPEEEVSLGEWVDALVMQKEDQDGRLILSKKRARFEKAWKRIEAAAAAGEHVEGTVIEVVKGGLILDLGVRGFLPASLVDIRRVQDLDEFLGRKLECKVIELNRNRNNVVLSRRAVLEDERREVRQKILDELQPGQVVEGVISNIVEFGAFVDLDGIDGLIHISELSWSHVNHPSEVLQIGEKVKVKVLDIDRDRQRISLGLKQTQADPWQSVIESYQVNDVVEGRVTKVVTFGAFVEIHAGVEGLVHISELAAHHVENPREVVNQGDVLAVRVIEIDADRRRLSLSLKRVADSDPIQHHLPDEIRNAVIVEEAFDEPAVVDAVEEAHRRGGRRGGHRGGCRRGRRGGARPGDRRRGGRGGRGGGDRRGHRRGDRRGGDPSRRRCRGGPRGAGRGGARGGHRRRGHRGGRRGSSSRTPRRPRTRAPTAPDDGRGARRDGAPLCLALTGGIGSGKSRGPGGACRLRGGHALQRRGRPRDLRRARGDRARRRAVRPRRAGGRRARSTAACWARGPSRRRAASPSSRGSCTRASRPAGTPGSPRRRRGPPAAAAAGVRGARALRGRHRGPVRRRPGGDGRPRTCAGRGSRRGDRTSTPCSARQLPEADKVARADRAYVNDGDLADLRGLGRRPLRRVRWSTLWLDDRRRLRGSRRAARARPGARPGSARAGGAAGWPGSCSPWSWWPRSGPDGSRSTARCRPGTRACGTRWSTRSAIRAEAARYDLDPALVAAVINTESGFVAGLALGRGRGGADAGAPRHRPLRRPAAGPAQPVARRAWTSPRSTSPTGRGTCGT